MLKHKSLLKEMKDVPADRLEEVYQFIHSLNIETKQSETSRKKILSFGGAFKDLPTKEYSEFVNHTKKIRKKLFTRKNTL